MIHRFCTSICESHSPESLAELALYITCQRKRVKFEFRSSRLKPDLAGGFWFNKKDRTHCAETESVFDDIEDLEKWKRQQQQNFQDYICLKDRKKLNTVAPGSNEDTASTNTARLRPIRIHKHKPQQIVQTKKRRSRTPRNDFQKRRRRRSPSYERSSRSKRRSRSKSRDRYRHRRRSRSRSRNRTKGHRHSSKRSKRSRRSRSPERVRR